MKGLWQGLAAIESAGFGSPPTRDYRFILSIDRAADGSFVGFADAPDLGVMRMPLERLRIEKTEISCEIPAMGARFRALQSEDRAVLEGRLEFGSGGVPLRLRRNDPAFRTYEVPRTNSRGEPVLEFGYTPPEDQGDGWATGTLDGEGVSEAHIASLLREILGGDFAGQESLLIARNGKLVLEEYFRGQRGDQTHTIQSATKSVTSMVVGVAVGLGAVDLDAPVHTFFPEYAGCKWISRKYPITVRHALMMAGGLDWNEKLPYVDPRNDNRAMNGSGDWIRYVLDREPACAAGDTFLYCSGLTILLGGVVKNATGHYVDELAAQHLFGPLGISRYGWGSGAGGVRHTGGGLHLRARDLAKLGQLMLDGGRWQGRQILDKSWVEDSAAPRLDAQLFDEPAGAAASFDYESLHYGYQWWLPRYDVAGTRVDTIEAVGYGGQCLCIAPSLGAVIVLNAGDYEGERTRVQRMIADHLLPALLSLP